MKVLLYGDLQVTHVSPDYAEALTKTLSFLWEVVRSMRPQIVVNLGDTYDTNGLVDVRDLLAVDKAMRAISEEVATYGGKHLILLGNHDIGPGGRSAIEVLGDQYTDVVMEPRVYEVSGHAVPVIPYTRDYEGVVSVLRESAKRAPRFGLGHIEWLGAKLTPTAISKVGLSVDQYRDIFPGRSPIFFNGHYHNPLNFYPVYFVGSPLYKDFSDEVGAIPRGFTLFDVESQAIQQIRNPCTYLVRTVRVESKEDVASILTADDAATKLRVFAPRALFPELEEIRPRFLWLGMVPTDDAVVAVQHKVSVSPSTAGADILSAAVGAAPAELDRDLLREIGGRLFAS